MKLHIHARSASWATVSAFTLPEVLVSVAIIGVMFVSLYGGISSGFAVVSVSRENLRATQIMLEKMESMRLYSWSQINSNGFIPTTFSDQLFPATAASALATSTSSRTETSTTSSSGSGVTYYGTLTMSVPDIAASYSNNMRLVVLTVNWTNGNIARTREMQTYVSANGLQPYVY